MPTYTRAQLVAQVANLIGDASKQQWDDAEIQDYLQKAQESFVADTGCLRGVQYKSLVDGTYTYDLDDDTLDVVRVGISGGATLKKISKFDLDLMAGQNWIATTGTPTHYYAELATGKLNVWPTPTAANAGASNLIVEFIQTPTAMSGDSSTPFNSQKLLAPYIDAVAYGAAYQILFASSSPTDWEKGKFMLKLYNDKAAKCREIYLDMMNTTPMRMRVGGISWRVNNAR